MRQIYDKNIVASRLGYESYRGFDKHFNEMKKMYELAPDIKVVSHGIQFGLGDWTVVTQNMKGTATGTTYLDSTSYQPANKCFYYYR